MMKIETLAETLAELPNDLIVVECSGGRSAKRGDTRGARAAMLRADPRCRWCGVELTEDTATVEHLIPLSRGGSNRRDNLALACEPCNKARSASLAAPERGA